MCFHVKTSVSAELTSGQNEILRCNSVCFSGPEQVNLKAGDDAVLQCRGPADAAVQLLEWRKPELSSEDYVLFYRDDHMYQNYQNPSGA